MKFKMGAVIWVSDTHQTINNSQYVGTKTNHLDFLELKHMFI